MKAFVTGAAGFAGGRLVERLLGEGLQVVAADRASCDLGDLPRLTKWLADERPDFVVHLAARTVPGSQSPEEFAAQREGTLLPALNVAHALPEGVRLAAFVGSIEEYGDNAAPFREDQSPAPFSAYGWAKVAAHAGARLICRSKRLPFSWLRPSLLYGPGMSDERLVGALARAHAHGSELKLTPGEQERDFLYVDDFCEMIARLLRNPQRAAEGEVFNLSTEGRWRIRELAAEFARIAGSSGQVRVGALPYRESESMEFWSSGAKFRAAFGAVEATPLEAGLSQTLAAARARAPRTVSAGTAGTQAPHS